jgi:hypothetical protein
MNDAAASPTVDTPQNAGVFPKKFLLLVVFALATHLALIFLFGTKKQIVARPVTNVPQLQLGNAADELLKLNNPALFALPNLRDFSAVIWQRSPTITQPAFHHAEAPRYLASPESLGAAFTQFMQTNRFGNFALNFKPAPMFAEPVAGVESALPQRSTRKISGALAQRKLLAAPALPSLTLNDIIAPSTVQVLVDRAGYVVSAVLLARDNFFETAGRMDNGDTNAIVLARQFKFAPAPQPTFGEIIFRWHTTPLTLTNSP